MIECPYCEREMEDPHSDWYEDGNSFKYECDKCNKEFDVDIYWDVVFYPSKKKELTPTKKELE